MGQDYQFLHIICLCFNVQLSHLAFLFQERRHVLVVSVGNVESTLNTADFCFFSFF